MLRRLGLRRADLAAVLRHQGADDVGEVEESVFGPGGSIVVSIDPELRDVTKSDLERATAAMRSELTTLLSAMEERLSARFDGGPAPGLGLSR